MGRNEIRIRRQTMTSGRIAKHRNYGEVMARHIREQRIKRGVRVIMYLLIIAFIFLLFFLVNRLANKGKEVSPKSPPSNVHIIKKTGEHLT